MDNPMEPFICRKLRGSLWSDCIIVHDKYICKCLCDYHELPVPKHYGIYRNALFDGQGTDLRHLMLKNNLTRIVLKPMFGCQGKGIQFISRSDLDSPEALGNCEKGEYIVEGVIKQHPELDKLNPYSTNSVRAITILCSDGSVEFLSAMLKTSSSTSPVDNFYSGGIVIGVDLESGRLKKEGVMQFPQGKIVTEHPVTGWNFLIFKFLTGMN